MVLHFQSTLIESMKSTAMECKRQIFIPMCTLVCTKRRSPQWNSSGNTLLEQLVHRMLTAVGR